MTMKLTGLHLLLTLRCNLECDHCFVWGGPRQTATMTRPGIRDILRQAVDLGGVEWIHFEGGEPMLERDLLLAGAREAAQLGFQVGVVTNCFWAADAEAARAALRPFAGLLNRVSISADAMHWNDGYRARAEAAVAAAREYGMSVSPLDVVRPAACAPDPSGALPPAEPSIMYRGRAAERLAPLAARRPWEQFTACPHENLRAPARVHVDPRGDLHVCQGLSMGNLFQAPLRDLCAAYDPDAHPIVGPLVAGGPAELIRRYAPPHEAGYVDACHACYEVRRSLRERFPEVLTPLEMYDLQDAPSI